MKMISEFLLNKNVKKTKFLLNFTLFILFLKQIFWEGNEAKLIDLNSIVLLPFIYGYSLVAILFIVFLYKKNTNIFLKTIAILILFLVLLYPLQFIKLGIGKILTIPIFVALLEIFQDTSSIAKQIELLVVTFLLLFVAGMFAKLFGLQKSQWYMYGCLYYLYILWRSRADFFNKLEPS